MSEEERKKIVGKFRKQIVLARKAERDEKLRKTGMFSLCGGQFDLEAEANKMADAYIKEMQEKEKS